MGNDSNDNVTLSDGTTKPQTDTEHPSSISEILTNPIKFSKETHERLDNRYPTPPTVIYLFIFLYILILLLIAFLVSPFHTFGLISATTGIVAIIAYYHPDGFLTARTTDQKYLYLGGATAFILVGLRYLLAGVLFSQPFT